MRKGIEIDQAWISACVNIKDEIKDLETFNRWIEIITPVSSKADKVVLGVPNDFTARWIQEHFEDIISNALKTVLGKSVRIKFETGHEPPARHEQHLEKRSAAAADRKHQALSSFEASSAPNCNQRFTFNNFVVGPENSLAYEAALSVMQPKSGLSVNPLFIYSSPGLGKTHLLQAVANEAMKINRRHVVEYLRCEDFLNMYTDSIRTKNHHSFRDRFRKVDYLLIDDIHFLAGKKNLQEEFFNTFNKLHNEDKKILLTSDKTPAEINGLEHRLISRFVSGLIVEITPFSEETKFAILRKKQEEHLIKFDDKVLWFIAQNTNPDVRKLEGALRRLILYSSVRKIEIDLSIAQEVLKDFLAEMAAVRLTVETIQKKVADYFDLRVSDLTSNKRPANIAGPRMVAMYLCRKMTDKSLLEIGEAFGRNHATVIHAYNKIEREFSSDEQMKRKISQLESRLQVV
ncbi:MAG TPA: chromosomal replication initiator protein DnaA [Lentisphaeria bacterium]|nr:MAG: hypothetical protein A2X45_03465 [Lentisphaerae bacterium GWF2_50_93]HCE46139.1 chromosomal replication initiator protein DnaA [Lentisphaeria bacterium]